MADDGLNANLWSLGGTEMGACGLDSLVSRRRRAADDPDPYVPGGRGQLRWTGLDWTGQVTSQLFAPRTDWVRRCRPEEDGGRRAKAKGVKLK